MAKRRLLLVEDDEAVRFAVRAYFTSLGYEVSEATTMSAAIAAFEVDPPEVAIVDMQLPDGNAIDVLPGLKERAPNVPIVVLTGHGSIDLAVSAIKAGAANYLTKPIELAALAAVVEREIQIRRVARRAEAGRIANERHRHDPFLGRSSRIRDLEGEARRILGSDSPVLILGETGTGKGVLATWLHANGTRAGEPCVDINCANLRGDFLDNEMFGHRKGAYTGADSDKAGLLEVADGGTVFLDEIGDMDLAVQAKLLKVVEEGRFRRLGDVQDRTVDVRLICATHRDLDRLIREDRFRSDLKFRIDIHELRVPALRERREDIPLLAPRIAEELGQESGRGTLEIAPDAIEALMDYHWPGNVRELKNVLERAMIAADGPLIERDDLRFGGARRSGDSRVPGEPASPASRPSGSEKLEDIERDHILRVLEDSGRKVDEAARRLGIPRSTLYTRLKDFGLSKRGGGEDTPQK